MFRFLSKTGRALCCLPEHILDERSTAARTRKRYKYIQVRTKDIKYSVVLPVYESNTTWIFFVGKKPSLDYPKGFLYVCTFLLLYWSVHGSY